LWIWRGNGLTAGTLRPRTPDEASLLSDGLVAIVDAVLIVGVEELA